MSDLSCQANFSASNVQFLLFLLKPSRYSFLRLPKAGFCEEVTLAVGRSRWFSRYFVISYTFERFCEELDAISYGCTGCAVISI